MVLRILVVCDSRGIPVEGDRLQYWSGVVWEDIPREECEAHEVDKYNVMEP